MDVNEPSALSMSAETKKFLVGLLQESNEKYDVLAEEHRDLKRRYKRLEEEPTSSGIFSIVRELL